MFSEFKELIEHYVGLERDALHIHGALLLYLAAMFVFRATRRSPLPWLFVLGIELANEAYDLWRQVAGNEPLRWHESTKDLWNTMLWPTVLLFGDYLPRRRTREGQPPPSEAPVE